MSEHVTLAEGLLEKAQNSGAGSDVAANAAAAAQVHATLALVEQQRIANLLALVTAREEDNVKAFSWAATERAATQVLEGLDLL